MQDQTHPRIDSATAAAPHVAILMGVLNGATNLDEQLQSFARQDHANWSLLASDDGSTDASRQIVERFAADHPEHRIDLRDGPKAGFAMNYLTMIATLGEEVDAAALSDQDDVWLPQRLSRGLAKLSSVPPGTPALYLGRTMICDAKLKPIRPSPEFTRSPDFGNALVQCIGGGNTMLLNREAIALVAGLAPRLKTLFAHDWWLYQLITSVGGQVVYDNQPMVLYRQHPANQIGRNDTTRAAASRLARLLNGDFSGAMDANLGALDAVSDRMTPEARAQLRAFTASRKGSLLQRLSGVQRAGLHRQRPHETLALYVSALLRKL